MHGTSRKTVTRIGVATLGALAVVGAIAAPSSAKALTYTVAVGSTTSGTASLSGSSVGAHTTTNPDLTFEDLRSGLPAACNTATAVGTAALTTAGKAKSLATITSTTYVGCESDKTLDLAVKPSGKWIFGATGATSGGVTPGTLTKIKAAVNDTDGFGCKFTIGGTLNASYNNNTHQLALSSTSDDLVISKQTGNCLSLAANGDKVTLTATFAVTTTNPAGVLSITSN